MQVTHKDMKNFRLINGTEIPAIGLGTWQTPDGETAVKAVSHAIKCGYDRTMRTFKGL